MGAPAVVGRRARFVFDALDSTVDLPEVGPVGARVDRVEAEGRLVCVILTPKDLKGFTLRADLRYEEESLSVALGGRPVTVNASIDDRGGRAVAGGIATMAFERGQPASDV